MQLPHVKRLWPWHGGRSPLAREIALLLALKIMLLYAIWFAFFSQPVLKKMTVGLDPARVAAVIAAPASPDAVPPAPTFPAATRNPNPDREARP